MQSNGLQMEGVEFLSEGFQKAQRAFCQGGGDPISLLRGCSMGMMGSALGLRRIYLLLQCLEQELRDRTQICDVGRLRGPDIKTASGNGKFLRH